MKNHVKLSGKVMWLLQIPSRFCFYVRNRRLFRVCLIIVLVFLYCELVHYYVVLLWCTWPRVHLMGRVLEPDAPRQRPLRAMFIGDTHILGSNAHWFDRLRREWQMVRSFQASMLIHNPDVVFILGDLLDNGKDCSPSEFRYHVERFKSMFQTPATTRREIVVGNHDVGFHYMMTDRRHGMFVKGFHAPSIQRLHLGDSMFVLINSMAMEGDGCSICKEAEDKLREIRWTIKCAQSNSEMQSVPAVCDRVDRIKYTKPIILQHFPMYRASDINCSTPDAPPDEEKAIPFRPKMDCLSMESSKMLLDWLDPRLIISAHTHHGCYRVHENGAPEYTVASYNWRNKPGPTFLLAEITGDDYAVHRCYLPNEITVFSMYAIGALLVIVVLLLPMNRTKMMTRTEQAVANKCH